MGVVYVLRSLSEDPQVLAIPNLHKIGFTKGTTTTRIGNAKRSKTYLNAPVKVVAPVSFTTRANGPLTAPVKVTALTPALMVVAPASVVVPASRKPVLV